MKKNWPVLIFAVPALVLMLVLMVRAAPTLWPWQVSLIAYAAAVGAMSAERKKAASSNPDQGDRRDP